MEPQWTHCYRMRSYYRNVGVVCTVAFAVMGGVSTLVAFFNVDGSFPNPWLAVWTLASFWSAFVLLGLWLLLAYSKYRLFVSPTSLRQVGVVREQYAELNLVDELRWRRFPAGGSVRLAGPFGMMKIELSNFSSADRKQVISFLRDAVDSSRQPGWHAFTQQYEDTPARCERARRAAFVCGIAFLVLAVGFLIAWIAGLGVVNLAVAIVNAIVGGRMLRNRVATHPL